MALYTISCGDLQQVDTLRKHWFKEAIPSPQDPRTLIVPLTDMQAFNLERDTGLVPIPLKDGPNQA